MFEVNGVYANRKGTYTVLDVDGRRMHVRYEDGTYAELNMAIQGRIWENIVAEREAAEAKASREAESLRRTGQVTHHYVKAVSIPDIEELMFPGWQERIVMATNPIQASRIKPGDRLCFYAIETDMFFAIATITGDAFKADPNEYFYGINVKECYFFPIDIDVAGLSPNGALSRDSVELEEYTELKENLAQVEAFISIGEDDFELLTDLLTEQTDSDGNGIDEEDFEEEDDE